MAKLKRTVIVFLSALFLLSTACFVASCSDNGGGEAETTPSIELSSAKMLLSVGQTKKLDVIYNDVTGDVEWMSYDENVVEVQSDGTVVALGTGTAAVLATVGEYTASCVVTVTEATVEAKNLSLELSSAELVLNAASASGNDSAVISVTASYNGNKIDAQFEWESSDSDITVQKDQTDSGKATVKASVNGKTATVTVKTVYNGIRATATCKVVSEEFAYIAVKESSITLFEGDTATVDFDLYVGGVKNQTEKANVEFSSSDNKVVSVNENGELTVNGGGAAVITLTYGTKKAQVNVNVGETVYVSTASQFLQLDGATRLDKYVITNNIDLSGYYDGVNGFDAKYFIESFDGVLVGNGHSVYGLNRYATDKDSGFNGIFNKIGENAVIGDLRIIADIDVKYGLNALANVNYGVIRNCIFELKLNVENGVYSLFNMHVGKIENSVFSVEFDVANADFSLSNKGYGRITDSIFISPVFNSATTVLGLDGDSDKYYGGTYYYESGASFAEKNGYAVVADGKGERKDFGSQANYDSEIFSVQNGKINFASTSAPNYSFERLEGKTYETAKVGEQITLVMPEDLTVSVTVFDAHDNDVTAETYSDGKFKPLYAGDYKILYTAKNGDVRYGAVSLIRAIKYKAELDNYSVMFSVGQTFAITSSGQKLDTDAFKFAIGDAAVATVSADGTLTAVGAGETTLTVIGKTENVAYTVAVKVQSDYSEVSTVDGLVAALNGATKNSYIVMTADIEVPNEKLTYKPASVKTASGDDYPYYLVFLVENFLGTLDGQGYKLTINYDNRDRTFSEDVAYKKNDRDLMCGMFYKIEAGAVVKNLNYEFNASYVPSAGITYGYTSAFVYFLKGHVRDCYLKANLNPTKNTGNAEGVIGMMWNDSVTSNTAYCYNVLFDISTKIDGVSVDNGYAVRWGYNGPYCIDCALIRNGGFKEFFGDRGYHGSAVQGTNNNSYQTVYNFINGIDGYNYTAQYVLTKIINGDKRYAAWSSSWSFAFNEIRLCGKKIIDVQFEAYTADETLTVDEYNGTLSWETSGSGEIYVDGAAVATVTNGSFDLYGYLASSGATAGSYEIMVKDGDGASCALYQIIEIGGAEFIETLRSVDSAEKASFKMFVLTEDVTLKPWVNGDNGDFKAKFGDCYYAVLNSYANIDGRGHAINAAYTATKASDMKFGGIAQYLHGGLRNTVYNLKANYLSGGMRFFVAYEAVENQIESCVFNVSAHATDANGNRVIDEIRQTTAAFNLLRGATISDSIFLFNFGGECPSETYLAHRSLSTATVKNVIVVTSSVEKMTKQIDDPNSYINCRTLSSVSELTLNFAEYGIEGAITGADGVIRLADRVVIGKIVDDDTVVSDEDIL